MRGVVADGRSILVEIHPHFSKTFTDEEARELDQRLRGRAVNGKEPIPFSFKNFLQDPDRMVFTLRSFEREKVVETVLMVGAMRSRPVGVLKVELYQYFGTDISLSAEIQNLIDDGYFREETIIDALVIFPTDELLGQIVRRRKEYREMYGLKDPAAN